MEDNQIYEGDCLDVMREMEPNTFDGIVTDPPYGLEFMGKEWDKLWSERPNKIIRRANGKNDYCDKPKPEYVGGKMAQDWHYRWAVEALRVAKPGAHLLAFGGTRTFHRLACAIEDAGWEIRDTIMWVYGSGFPKSHDISKAIDKAAGAEREVVGRNPHVEGRRDGGIWGDGIDRPWKDRVRNGEYDNATITAPATDAARQWDGWGTALKPAWEPIIVARKPLEGTVAANVLKWGTGGINVDGGRVGTDGRPHRIKTDDKGNENATIFNGRGSGWAVGQTIQGRFPANLIHDGSDEVLELFPPGRSAGIYHKGNHNGMNKDAGSANIPLDGLISPQYSDIGSAARFFYTAKASKRERGEYNNHPTVKPIALLVYLVKLITPEGALILDPFGGSGSTAIACQNTNRRYILIEKEHQYTEIARKRIAERLL